MSFNVCTCVWLFPHIFGDSHTYMYVVITKHVGSYQHRMGIPTHVWFFPHIWICGNNQTCVGKPYFCLVSLELQVSQYPYPAATVDLWLFKIHPPPDTVTLSPLASRDHRYPHPPATVNLLSLAP